MIQDKYIQRRRGTDGRFISPSGRAPKGAPWTLQLPVRYLDAGVIQDMNKKLAQASAQAAAQAANYDPAKWPTGWPSLPPTISDDTVERCADADSTGWGVSPLPPPLNHHRDDFQTCGHLAKVLQRSLTRDVLLRCVNQLRDQEDDSLAFCGMSGALVAPILANMICKELIMVRIPGTPRCHSRLPVEGYSGSKRYVLVDDLISGGRTCARIINGVRLFAPKAELIGVLLYNSPTTLYPVGSTTYEYVIKQVKIYHTEEME